MAGTGDSLLSNPEVGDSSSGGERAHGSWSI